jgi:predicted small metal-binding protein
VRGADRDCEAVERRANAMYEVSCRDLGLTDCDFDLMACSLERLELGILAHARYEHPDACSAVLAGPDSPERQALRERIAAAAHEVALA